MAFYQKIKNIIKYFIPYGIIFHYNGYKEQKLKKQQKLQKAVTEQEFQDKEQGIRNYFLSLNTDDPEFIEIIDYFKKYRFSIYPYEFQRKYHAEDIDVFYDVLNEMRYVIHEHKRLYFPEDWESATIRTYYNGLCIEQDKESPHHYETDEFFVQEGDVIADIGAAEGIWALNYAEKAGKIYLFECSPAWIKALEKTFEPWKEKVIIVNKYVSNVNDDKNVTLDSFFNDEVCTSVGVNFIKVDIEGMEINLLQGSSQLLANSNNLKLLLCAYHSKNDATKIKEILENHGFKTEYSKRYMIFIFDKDLEEPYIRRGLVRAR